MGKLERNTLLIKMKRVLRSCNTPEQLESALSYARLVRRTLDRNGWILHHNYFYQDFVTEEVMYVTHKIASREIN